jgi:hypothetical protein
MSAEQIVVLVKVILLLMIFSGGVRAALHAYWKHKDVEVANDEVFVFVGISSVILLFSTVTLLLWFPNTLALLITGEWVPLPSR